MSPSLVMHPIAMAVHVSYSGSRFGIAAGQFWIGLRVIFRPSEAWKQSIFMFPPFFRVSNSTSFQCSVITQQPSSVSVPVLNALEIEKVIVILPG